MFTDSSFTFVLFGGTGDLSMRKILPALYEAHRAGMLAEGGKIVGVARHAEDRSGSTNTSSRTSRRTVSTKRHGPASSNASST
jgi:glucose-6-phosphate 1-dehydrogenase